MSKHPSLYCSYAIRSSSCVAFGTTSAELNTVVVPMNSYSFDSYRDNCCLSEMFSSFSARNSSLASSSSF